MQISAIRRPASMPPGQRCRRPRSWHRRAVRVRRGAGPRLATEPRHQRLREPAHARPVGGLAGFVDAAHRAPGWRSSADSASIGVSCRRATIASDALGHGPEVIARPSERRRPRPVPCRPGPLEGCDFRAENGPPPSLAKSKPSGTTMDRSAWTIREAQASARRRSHARTLLPTAGGDVDGRTGRKPSARR